MYILTYLFLWEFFFLCELNVAVLRESDFHIGFDVRVFSRFSGTSKAETHLKFKSSFFCVNRAVL